MSRPITFQNNKQPCLNAENLNKMQDELNMFRNLLNIPDGTYTHNGVTYIAKNGVLTYSSGTATSDVNIGINITPFTLKSGTYTMSNNSGNYPYIMLFSGDTKVVESEYADNGVKTFTIENEKTINNVYLYFGQSTPPASVKPQLEENTTATSFTSWAGYIEESGSNENGSWIKYSDGTMICYKTVTGTPESTLEAWGNIFYANVSCGDWPQTFKSILNCQATCNTIQYWISKGTVTETSAGSVRLLCADNNIRSYKLYLTAIGRWK